MLRLGPHIPQVVHSFPGVPGPSHRGRGFRGQRPTSWPRSVAMPPIIPRSEQNSAEAGIDHLFNALCNVELSRPPCLARTRHRLRRSKPTPRRRTKPPFRFVRRRSSWFRSPTLRRTNPTPGGLTERTHFRFFPDPRPCAERTHRPAASRNEPILDSSPTPALAPNEPNARRQTACPQSSRAWDSNPPERGSRRLDSESM
jgi:hypothetical protein